MKYETDISGVSRGVLRVLEHPRPNAPIKSMPHLPHLGHGLGKHGGHVVEAWPHGSGKMGHLSKLCTN